MGTNRAPAPLTRDGAGKRSVRLKVVRDPRVVLVARHRPIRLDVPRVLQHSHVQAAAGVLRDLHAIRDESDPRDVRRPHLNALAHAEMVRAHTLPGIGPGRPVKGFIRDGLEQALD